MSETISPTGDGIATTKMCAHEKNISMLFEKLKELKMCTENSADASIFYQVEREYSSIAKLVNKLLDNKLFKFLELLQKEIDKVQMSQYDGIECDSDGDITVEESDEECFSNDESVRQAVDYDLDQMFEIVKKCDFSKWSIGAIHNQYKQIHDGDAGKKEISRYICRQYTLI